MKTYRIEPTLASWRDAARQLLSAKVPPSEVIWHDGTGTPPLFTDEIEPVDTANSPTIPRGFFSLAQLVACHREPERWALLYEAAHRIAVGKERHLLEFAAEPLVRTLNQRAKAVSRDRHKMKAFVRFRKLGELPGGPEQFVAWFEPEHHIVELTAPFFAKRFASFDWTILTPDQCAHWDGKALNFTAGVSAIEAPSGDALEDYWKTYYASIFNPARLKLKAMQSEMPKKYWKNLPEATLIAELTSKATHRTDEMIQRPPTIKPDGRTNNRQHWRSKPDNPAFPQPRPPGPRS